MMDVSREHRAAYLRNCRILSVLCAIAAVGYLKWLLIDAKVENWILYGLLVAAELFNIVQAAGFWYTISTQKWTEPEPVGFEDSSETVDVFITVCGEPIAVVARTLEGAMAIRHPRKRVYILDDGHSGEIRVLTELNGARYLTRHGRVGAKAGNINAALRRTTGEFVVIFDADHAPDPDFLELTMGAFDDGKVAFVQTPQSYANRVTNRVAAGAHEQQGLFYGPIMRGRNSCNAAFACGTNLVFRRSALDSVGGMPEDSITEDLRISLLLLEKGYTSVYVPIVLAHGMGPVDVGSYFGQQSRWARGGLEILFKRRPFFKGMPISTRIQYSLSFMYWFTGLAFACYIALPAAFLFTGVRPVVAPNEYPVFFVPYILITLGTIVYASGFKVTFRALWFTLGSFPVFIAALFSSIFGRAAHFVVTSKGQSKASLRPVVFQLAALALLITSIVRGVLVLGFTPGVMNNVAFALGDILVIQGFIRYARRPEISETVGFASGHAEAIEAVSPASAREAASEGEGG